MTPLENNIQNDVIEIDLREVWRKVLKHRHVIFSTIAVAVVAALIASFTAVPVFSAAARILVEGKPPKIVKVEDVIMPDYTDRTNFFNSQIEILKSHSVADMVFDDIGTYEPAGRRVTPADKLKEISRDERVNALLKQVKITPVRMTQVIDIRVEDPDPDLAARIANAWTRAYVLFSSVDQLLQRRSELESDLAQQLKVYKDKHPVITGLKSEIEAINLRISSERRRLSVDEKLPAGSLSGSSDITNVKILDRAQVPVFPVRPRKALNVVLAFILGLFAGLGLVFLFESLDQTLKTGGDIETILKTFCLVPVPLHKADSSRPDAQPEFVSSRDRHSTISEAFRGLRTSILFSNPDLQKKTFLVTSPSPSEGKTTVSVNLATVFAQAEERTILVDTDLRNPRLHMVFKVDRANGITDILALGKTDIKSFIHKTDVPNLDLLTCGEVPPNPSELLGSRKMEDFIARLLKDYDRVIFDTPPVLAATDAVVLSTKVDAAILVVKSGSTHRQAALRAVEAFRAVNARLLGAVLNMINSTDQNAYHYYYYHYGQNASSKSRSDKKKT